MLLLRMLRFTVVTPGAVVSWLPWLVVRSWGARIRWIVAGERQLVGVIQILVGLAIRATCAASRAPVPRGIAPPPAAPS